MKNNTPLFSKPKKNNDDDTTKYTTSSTTLTSPTVVSSTISTVSFLKIAVSFLSPKIKTLCTLQLFLSFVVIKRNPQISSLKKENVIKINANLKI